MKMEEIKDLFKDNIVLDPAFPFCLYESTMEPYYDMNKTFHWHECLEISYVKQGKGRYYIEDKVYEIEPGNIIIINNIELHYLEVYDKKMLQPVIVFDPSLVWSNLSNSSDYNYLKPFFERGSNFSNKLDITNPIAQEIRENIALLEKEFFEKPEGYQLMIKARLMMILTYLIRYFRDDRKSNPASKRVDLQRLEEVLIFIGQNYSDDIKLEDAAVKLHVTPQYFSTFFKKVMGKTFIEYLNGVRISHAISMLSNPTLKITNIAIDCGFNNMANFNSVFKRITGKTPSEFRVNKILYI